MINPEELAICKRRGHHVVFMGTDGRWHLCSHCGAWLREVRTIEEREDEPPKAEQSVFDWKKESA